MKLSTVEIAYFKNNNTDTYNTYKIYQTDVLTKDETNIKTLDKEKPLRECRIKVNT